VVSQGRDPKGICLKGAQFHIERMSPREPL
jgi:hypothetical protein